MISQHAQLSCVRTGRFGGECLRQEGQRTKGHWVGQSETGNGWARMPRCGPGTKNAHDAISAGRGHRRRWGLIGSGQWAHWGAVRAGPAGAIRGGNGVLAPEEGEE